MNYDVIHAEYLDAYRLKLSFADGSSGEADLLPFIEKGGVFEILRDVERFKLFSVDPDWSTVTWQDGELDIAPETLYFAANGSWPTLEPVMKVAEMPPEYGSSSSKQ
jgi:hypothetical protein